MSEFLFDDNLRLVMRRVDELVEAIDAVERSLIADDRYAATVAERVERAEAWRTALHEIRQEVASW
jgi:hypothetical protein